MNEVVFTSFSRSELEEIISGCLNACLKTNNYPIIDNPVSEYVTPYEASKLINCSRRKIDMCAAEGTIKRYKVGRKTQYLRSEVLSIVKPVKK